MSKQPNVYLTDILESIELIERYVAGKSLAEAVAALQLEQG